MNMRDERHEAENPNVAEELGTLEVEEADDSRVWTLALVPEWLGAVVLMVLTMAITVGVIARLTGHAITGIVELAGASMVVMVILGTAAVAMRDGHVRLEVIDPLLTEKSLKVVNLFSLGVQIVVSAALSWACWLTFLKDVDRGTTLPGELAFPRMYVSGVVAVCCIVLLLSLIRRLMTDVRRRHTSVLAKDASATTDVKGDA
ncbi:TRAP transporter small permease [Propioniferax innocua]|uniref:TRAP-type C4-dicarboxylate transport system permease small subunit n=1 Tax=Propioniferax innocua TaxID=1753 RepID=A0A542ZCF2_9ACTN|nr:TRAP transporter small permease subunit [Propioniferax innocua]TQL58032.1 TRAP-type C4-dicarboxylate transport system permease small subunit [Propioniferax innocua]